ncbi:MAG: AsmA family protein [Aromatoleum sp.]|nr:AsmA family protein [Aromatoleum sp.]
MRIFWTILAVAGGIVVLALVGVAVAIWTVDVNTFVGPIQQRVKDATGRDLSIRGGIDINLSLEPRLVIEDVTLGNATWGKQPQMLTAKRVEAQVALLPLLQRRFEIVRFKLVEPTITLETDPDGRGNWEFPPRAGPTATPQVPGGARSLDTLGIGDLEIDKGTMTYRDGATGNMTRVTIDELVVHARDPQSPVSARFRGTVDDIAVALEGNLGPLEQLVQRRWPYPIAVRGEVNGQQAAVSTKVELVDKGLRLNDVDLTLGTTKANGQATVLTGGRRPKLVLRFNVATLSLADLAAVARAAPAAGVATGLATPVSNSAADTARRSRYVFADTPLPLAALRSFDADGDVAIGSLLLGGGRHVDKVVARFTLVNGRLEAPALEAAAFGGLAKANLVVDASTGQTPTIALRADARDFDLGAVLAALGNPREVKGGKTDVTLDVTLRGSSPRQWVSAATGTLTATVGPATLSNAKFNLDSALDRLGDAVNPFRKSDPMTEVECVAIRLPLRDGIARIDRSVAMETKKVGVSASGTLDFRNETLDLALNPRVKQGIKIEVPHIADLVRFTGTFEAPTVSVDAIGSAATVARVGAAFSTGGLSVVGETLFKLSTSGSGNLCQIALAHAPSNEGATSAPAARNPVAPAIDEVGKAIGKLFGR